MAVYVPAPDVWQIEIRGTLHGAEYENVMYFKKGPEGASPSTVAENIADWLSTLWASNWSGDLVFDEIYMTDLTTATSPTFSLGLSPTIPGTLPQPGLPGSNCLCLSFRTAARGRSARGRNYYGGLGEGQVVGNLVDAAVVTAVIADLNALRATLLGDGWQHVVLSREFEGAPRAEGLARVVTDVIATTRKITSQRDRTS